jgi:hypothetical protein
MQRFWKPSERKPGNVIELMRLSVPNGRAVDLHLEIECDPVRSIALVLSMHVPVPEEFIGEHGAPQLLLNFLFERSDNRVMELKPAAAAVPATVLIPAIHAPLRQDVLAVSVMADKHDGDSRIIDAFFHVRSIPF